jgi:hypothetical protein
MLPSISNLSCHPGLSALVKVKRRRKATGTIDRLRTPDMLIENISCIYSDNIIIIESVFILVIIY